MKVTICLLVFGVIVVNTAEIRFKRDFQTDGTIVNFPESITPVTQDVQNNDRILNDAVVTTNLERAARSPDDEYEDYEVADDGPEGRHFHHIKRKIKRKFKPHKHQGYGGIINGLLGGGHGGYGGHGGHGHHGHGGHGGGYGCRALYGCGGGGWNQPSYGHYGPVATAIAGPSPGYGGWNPGYGGPGYGSNAQSQFATWNLGPFQATFGLAQAG